MADAGRGDDPVPAARLDVADGRATFESLDAAALAHRLALPRVELFARVGSTMDVAHALGAGGAPAGTLVLAEAQTAGRGRAGRPWHSPSGAGIWLTLVERPADASALHVLSLRAGLAAAAALDRFAEAPVRLKWPNDLYVGAGKLAGVLIEARWREDRPDWVALGLGVNVVAPAGAAHAAAGLRVGTRRLEVLESLVPALRAAARARGPLDGRELARFAERDLARGREARRPARGVVAGITADGELAVAVDGGVRTFRSGSLELEGDA